MDIAPSLKQGLSSISEKEMFHLQPFDFCSMTGGGLGLSWLNHHYRPLVLNCFEVKGKTCPCSFVLSLTYSSTQSSAVSTVGPITYHRCWPWSKDRRLLTNFSNLRSQWASFRVLPTAPPPHSSLCLAREKILDTLLDQPRKDLFWATGIGVTYASSSFKGHQWIVLC